MKGRPLRNWGGVNCVRRSNRLLWWSRWHMTPMLRRVINRLIWPNLHDNSLTIKRSTKSILAVIKIRGRYAINKWINCLNLFFFYILTILLLEVKVFNCFSKTRVRLHIEHTACHDVPSWNLKEMAITHVIASY